MHCGPLARLELLGRLWIQCTDNCEGFCGADDYPARERSLERVPYLHAPSRSLTRVGPRSREETLSYYVKVYLFGDVSDDNHPQLALERTIPTNATRLLGTLHLRGQKSNMRMHSVMR